MADSDSKRDRLVALRERVLACQKCELGASRTNAVFGSGSPAARLMFVGEAPGYHEDQQGKPFVGQAGKLLEKLLERIGLTRQDVFIANVLKCRPPDNRDPLSEEIDCCRAYLEEQVDVIKPAVVCTLGNFATKLLTGQPDGISRVHGQPRDMPGKEEIMIFPVYHPAAALYTPSNLRALEADFDRLPALMHADMAAPEEPGPSTGASSRTAVAPVEGDVTRADPEQLGLF